jgi:hypothetical protein
MDQIPAAFYYVVGFILITNLSTLGALIVFIFKCGQFVSDTKHGIKDAKEAAVRAHKRIDKYEIFTNGGDNDA